MATLLSTYQQKKEEMIGGIQANSLALEKMLLLQELNYRICVLQTMQSFCQMAPDATDIRACGFHYQLTEAYLRFLLQERRFGSHTDDSGLRKRETAKKALLKICEDGRRRFTSFQATDKDSYRTRMSGMINTVLPAWVQYRNTYIEL